MRKISQQVAKHLTNLSTEKGVISALAIDQRGSLKKSLAKASQAPVTDHEVIEFKKLVSKELTSFASGILTDPQYGLPAAKARDNDCGLLLAYEKTGYDTTEPGRYPDLIFDQSAMRLVNDGADGIKFLLYYDPDEAREINDAKQAFVERVGQEVKANGLPFFLELLTYDSQDSDNQSFSYARKKPEKVLKTMKEFSNPKYQVTVLKVEMPFNIKYLEGFNGDNQVAYSQKEAKELLKKQSQATDLPYIFLSGGVSAAEFLAEINLASQAQAQFNGVLCGRATWQGAVAEFAQKGKLAAGQWLDNIGKKNIEKLNQALSGAKSWQDKLAVQEEE